MANSNGWGDGAANNSIGWGQGANNAISWGDSHAKSWAGATDIVGLTTDPDAQAFITAAAITNPTQQTAIDTLVKGMKADGIWTKMKAIYPFVGGTASSHKFNLKDPRDLDAAFRLVFNGGWTHSANGATPNGTNGYANTYLIPNNVIPTGGEHLSYYSRTNSTTDADYLISGESSSPTSALGIVGKRNANLGVNGRGFYTTSNPSSTYRLALQDNINRDTRGLFVGFSNGSNTYYMLNGVTLAQNTTLQTFTSRALNSLVLSALKVDNTFSYYTNKQVAFASIGDGLTDTEAANLYTRVQAFQTALSRQV